MQQNSKPFESETKTFANCILDPMFQTIATPEKVIRLRGKLFSVLYCLVDNSNRLVTRDALIQECWHGNNYTGQKAVTHTICHLRKMLKQQKIEASITTLSKQGYIFSSIESHLFDYRQPEFTRLNL